ncbi:MAG TPA: DUF1801 domain-containing protein [Allosphingosinicella sp.]|nr:DUF1801 domain-containing protein [Allosphingosinicella sp.]
MAADVDAYMAALDHPLKEVVEAVRAALVGADPEVGERIKWNAPSFTWLGEDRVTFNLRPGAPVLLVFHRGARAKGDDGFAFADETGLMDWKAPDRAVVTLRGAADWAAHGDAIIALARRWLATA